MALGVVKPPIPGRHDADGDRRADHQQPVVQQLGADTQRAKRGDVQRTGDHWHGQAVSFTAELHDPGRNHDGPGDQQQDRQTGRDNRQRSNPPALDREPRHAVGIAHQRRHLRDHEAEADHLDDSVAQHEPDSGETRLHLDDQLERRGQESQGHAAEHEQPERRPIAGLGADGPEAGKVRG